MCLINFVIIIHDLFCFLFITVITIDVVFISMPFTAKGAQMPNF